MREAHEITKISPITGLENTMTIVYDVEDMERWKSKNLNIQDVLYYLTDDEREFILTGLTKEDWDSLNLGDID